MPSTNYRVWAWGPPVGIGATGASFVGIAGVAKKASPQDPLIVANEVVCNALARALLLPCPPGATLEKGGESYFFSLDFNLAGAALPPADAAAIVAAHPRLAWGIILFDCLVMNHDRHSQNVAHDTATNRVQIFDHSHAFLRAGVSDISALLTSSAGQLCIGGHCLAQEVIDRDGLDIWAERIRQVPDYFIDGVIDAAITVGLDSGKKAECVSFLKQRRLEVGDIVKQHINQFPKLPKVTP